MAAVVTKPDAHSQPGKAPAVTLRHEKMIGESNLEAPRSHQRLADTRRTKIQSACHDGSVVLPEFRKATSFHWGPSTLASAPSLCCTSANVASPSTAFRYRHSQGTKSTHPHNMKIMARRRRRISCGLPPYEDHRPSYYTESGGPLRIVKQAVVPTENLFPPFLPPGLGTFHQLGTWGTMPRGVNCPESTHDQTHIHRSHRARVLPARRNRA